MTDDLGGEEGFRQISAHLGLRDRPKAYMNLADDILAVLLCKDLEADLEGGFYRSGYVGLCASGVCLVRLSLVINQSVGPSDVFGEMLESPSGEARNQLRNILRCVMQCGREDLWSLSCLSSSSDDLTVLCDLMRAHRMHPQRSRVLELDDDAACSGKLRDAFKAGLGQIITEAIDAVLCVLIAQDALQFCKLPGDEGFVACPGTSEGLRDECVRVPLSQRSEEEEEEPFAPGADLLQGTGACLREVLWEMLELPDSGRFDISETRELLRLVLSRPVLGLLVRSRVFKYAQAEPKTEGQKMDQQEDPELLSLSGLRAAHSGVEKVARRLGDATAAFHAALAPGEAGGVAAAQFEANVVPALLDLVREVATAGAKYLHQRIADAKAVERAAEEARLRLELEERRREKHRQQALSSAHLSSSSGSSDRLPLAPPRTACSADWLAGLMQGWGRKCAG